MAGWQKWAVIVGAVIAIIGQWWGAEYYLPAIGGVIALIGGAMSMKK